MKEFNINIEGYNVDGMCVGCLNYNRKMFHGNEVKDVFKILGEIDVPDGLLIQVCWECLAAAKRVIQFRQRILNSFDILVNYSHNHPFLKSPNDLSQFASTNVTAHISIPLDTSESLIPEIEIKEEIINFKDEVLEEDDQSIEYESYNCEAITDNQSSDDDALLIDLKEEDEDKKSKNEKRKKNTPKPQHPQKLKNLPKEIVELHTMDEAEMWSTRARDVANEEFVKFKRKCVDCIRCFTNQKLMDYHIEGKHSRKDSTYIQCDVCKGFFMNRENMLVHRNQHLNAYKCRICGLVTTLKMIISNHECAKRTGGCHTCSTCQTVFSTKSKLAYHRTVCKAEQPQCDCCGKVFANKNSLKTHLKSMSGVPANTSQRPNMYIPCKECDKVFNSRKTYKAHVYPCPICGKLFQWKYNVARHVRNHRERESGTTHYCRDCAKTFSSRDSYKNHMKFSKNHANERTRNHACDYCDKRFATKQCLVDHIDWDHLKRIKYRCRVCHKPFKTAIIMMTHMNNIHEGKYRENNEPEGEHLCEICGKSYKTVKRLKGHVWAMHTKRSDTKSFKCSLCPATFTWQTSIYKHMRMMHDNKRSKQPRALPAKKQES